jgi:hypothetical protein
MDSNNPTHIDTAAPVTATYTLKDEGLVLAVDGRPADLQVATGHAVATGETAIYLGKNGRTSRGLYPVVLQLPEKNVLRAEAIRAAVDRLGCGKLWSRLGDGWAETTADGDRKIYLGVVAASAEDFEIFIRTVAARTATDDGDAFARLLFAGSTPVASAKDNGPVSGRLGVLIPISASELAGIGAVFDEASDSRDKLARGTYNIREHDRVTNRIRDSFNRATTVEEVSSNLVRFGWTKTGEVSPAIHLYTRDEMEADLVLESRTLVVRQNPDDSLRTTAQVLRPFDIIVAFDPKWNEKLTPAEDYAAWLLNNAQVAPERGVYVGRDRPLVEPNQAFPDLVEAYASALTRSRSRSDATMPLAFAKSYNGKFDAVVSATPAGALFRWDGRNMASLMLAAAQPGRVKVTDSGDEVTTYMQSVPPTVVQAVARELEVPGALPPVEVLACQPVITEDGDIVSEPGYHREAKALISIPHRERAAWKTGFNPIITPTREDVQKAYEFARTEIMSDMPFATTTDASRYFAYLMTCCFRYTTNGSIGFAFNATDRGTGKSLAAGIGRQLGQGHNGYTSFRVGRWADEETKKELAMLLKSGGMVLHCDEVPQSDKVAGLVITELVTSMDGEKSIRLLGGQDEVTQSGVILTVAGSHIELGADNNRRYFMINLSWEGGGSPVARSDFRHSNLNRWVVQNRPQLLSAMFTILRYFKLHGAAHKIPGMGFNHDWPEKILGPLSNIVGVTGNTVAEEALDGWFEEVEEQDELGDEWGATLAELWTQLGARAAFPMDTIRSTLVKSYKRSGHLELPPALQGLVANTDSNNRAWSTAFKKAMGSTIPHIESGCTFRIQTTDRKTKSKQSATYKIAGFDKNGRILIPGRTLPTDGLTQEDVPEVPIIAPIAPEWAAILANLRLQPKAGPGHQATEVKRMVQLLGLPVPPDLVNASDEEWGTALATVAAGPALIFEGAGYSLSYHTVRNKDHYTVSETRGAAA